MTDIIKSIFKINDKCKCLHSDAFRSGDIFTIIGITPFFIGVTDIMTGGLFDIALRYVYVVQYEDGVIDSILIESEREYVMEKIDKRNKFKGAYNPPPKDFKPITEPTPNPPMTFVTCGIA